MKNVNVVAIAVLTLSTFAAQAADAVTTTSTTKSSTTTSAPGVKTAATKKHVVHTKQATTTDQAKVDTSVSTSTTTVK